jgi:ribosomal protein L12E/L44/L45/RPP1/RPP2
VLNTDPVRPHGPAGELTLDAEDQENAGIILDEIEIGAPSKPAEDIKIGVVTGVKAPAIKLTSITAPTASSASSQAAVAVSVAPAPTPAALPEEKKEEKSDDNDLNKLFSTDETEENPLASLINSLPDVTVQELLDDLAEIHGIIKEWRSNAK